MNYNELEKMIMESFLDEKEKKKRSTINFGNVAEGILAAAMAQRFVEGDQDVTADDVYATINDVEKRGSKSGGAKRSRYEMEWEIERSPGVIGCPPAPGRAKDVPDVLRLIIGLDQKDLDALFLGAKRKLSDVPAKAGKMSDQAQFDGLVNASVAHSNAEMPNFAKTWECNETEDEIWVIADGIGDQSGTKTDVVVKYKAEDGDMKFVPDSTFGKISLKAGSAQMGQAGSLFSGGDKDGDGIKELMGRIFSVDLKNPSSVGYDKVYKAFQHADAQDPKARDQLGAMLEKVYGQAYKEIARIFTNATPEEDAKWLSHLGQGIQNAAALAEKGVYLVNLDRVKGLFSQINFDDIEEVFEKTGADFEVVYDGYYAGTADSKTLWPNIQIFYCPAGGDCEGNDNLQLVKTRAKVEDRLSSKGEKQKRLAHYIEMGSGLKQLIKQTRKLSEMKQAQNTSVSYQMLQEMVENEISQQPEEELEEALDKLDEELYHQIVRAGMSIGTKDSKITMLKQLQYLADLTKIHYRSGGDINQILNTFNAGGAGTELPKPTGFERKLIKLLDSAKQVMKGEYKKGGNELPKNAIDKEFAEWKKDYFARRPNPIFEPRYKTWIRNPTDAYWFAFSTSIHASNAGLRREDGLAAYINFSQKNKEYARSEVGGAAGIDLRIGRAYAEVKGSKDKSPNFNLNSSAVTPDKNKAYFFLQNTSTTPIVYVVSSNLLYQVITFKMAGAPGTSKKENKKFNDNIEILIREAVADWQGSQSLADMVVRTVIDGKPSQEKKKTISLGKSPLKARIRIMFHLSKIGDESVEDEDASEELEENKDLTNTPLTAKMLSEMIKNLMSEE